jgi:hypothetical protein
MRLGHRLHDDRGDLNSRANAVAPMFLLANSSDTDQVNALARAEQIALLTELAQECFAVARWVPSEAELGWEYLAQRDALLANEPPSPEQPDLPQPEQPRHRRQRRPTLASVAKQASKAAIAVARYEVRPDGTVIIVTGTPEPSTESNPWLDDLKVTKQ